jgi:DNA-binding XRE family transcriptional regulator
MNGIKSNRIRLGLSQVEFGRKIGCSYPGVVAMERGDESVSASTYHRAAQYLGISLDEALAEVVEGAPLGCNVRRGAGTGENNILAAYKHENGLSLRNLAEILGSNYTTVMYDCRNESCRPYFIAILAENEGLTVGEFMEKYGGCKA